MSRRILKMKPSPAQLLLEKYNTMRKDEIIGVADWFNAVGKDEFDKAEKSGLIVQTKDNIMLWELNKKKMIKVVIPTEKGFESVYKYDKKGNLISHYLVNRNLPRKSNINSC